jgi:hypothetical protein
MPDQTAEFFHELARRGHEQVFGRAAGTIRFDLEHDHAVDHWLVTISKGDVRVSQEDRDADCVIRTTKALFDRCVTGDAYLHTAWLRNEVTATGDIALSRLFLRIVPGRHGAHHPRSFARERRQRA